ncbi:hemolysin family protein [bacterium]|jgi:CBS domain containing-hemolysin-like protein|nr:hemolysin family protein [bacterium]
MSLTLFSLFCIIPPLLLIEGFFSGSEIALLSADKMLLKAAAKKGSNRARLALRLTSNSERIFSTTLLMTNLCLIGISSTIMLYLLSKKIAFAEVIAVLVTSPLIVVFGEIIPKTIYQRYANVLAPWVAFPVMVTYYIFYPITRVLSGYTSKITRLISPIEEMVTGRERTTREELTTLLSYSKKETEITPTEKKMIKRILEFQETEAKHALIPLFKVEAVEDVSTIRQALELFRVHRHSRMPVYSERVDNIVGIIEVSDLFGITDLSQSIRNYITPAHYVAETQGLEDLLLDMQREGNKMVVVVDEYGGAIGVITFEDIVEEIVGEIRDEFDNDSVPYKELTPTSWQVLAKMEIQQLNEGLNLDIPEGDYETLGGFLLQQFGRIPEVRDELYFDTPRGTLKFTIRKATERQIESVTIERMLLKPQA